MSTLDDRQAAISDIKDMIDDLVDALDKAESCETAEGFGANIVDADQHMRRIQLALAEIR